MGRIVSQWSKGGGRVRNRARPGRFWPQFDWIWDDVVKNPCFPRMEKLKKRLLKIVGTRENE